MKKAGLLKTMSIWLAFIGVMLLAWQMSSSSKHPPDTPPPVKTISYDEFFRQVDAGNISQITMTRGDIAQTTCSIKGGFVSAWDGAWQFEGTLPAQGTDEINAYANRIWAKNPNARVDIDDGKEKKPATKVNNSPWLIPFIWLQKLSVSDIVMIAFLVYIVFGIIMMQKMGGMGGGGGRAMSFGKAKLEVILKGRGQKKFTDVAGCVEAKAKLEEIVEFLKDPAKFQALGGRIPKGVMLTGPPGTGKTLLAKAVAGEANVPFATISGSSFVEMFVGVGASRVRDLFEWGKKNAPCIIFIDEIDAVGRQRGAGLGGGHDEREQTLNEILGQMDGFETNEGVIVIAATNRPDVLDAALLRPGRFDRKVVVDRPDHKARLAILKVHTRRTPMADDVKLEVIARGTPGSVGADLANIVNEAALFAASKGRKQITMADFEHAKDEELMGAARKSLVMTPKEKELTAYHEAGHTLVALELAGEGADPMHKVTILPRGMALGLTQQLPEEDRLSYTKQQCKARIAVCMGGQVAELLQFDPEKVTTGCGSDIGQATVMARNMITQWGMTEELGPVKLGHSTEHIFLGRQLAETQKDYSEDTARKIDETIRKIVEEGKSRAISIINAKRHKLAAIANALVERETLDREELEKIMREL